MTKEQTAGQVLAHSVEQTASTVNTVVNNVANSKSVTTLDNALADMITSAVGGVKEGISFIQGQLPDVVYQLVVYNRVLCTLGFLFGIFLILLCVYAVKKFSKGEWDWEFSPVLVVPFIGSVFMIFGSTSEMLKLWFAPKIWLIEYAADLLQKVK